MPLATLNTLKTHLGLALTASAEDTFLSQVLAEVEQAVKSHIGWNPELQMLTEYYDGTGTPELPMRVTPVNSITSVHVDDNGYYGQGSGAFAASTLLTAGSQYCLRLDGPGGSYSASGILLRIGNVWPRRFVRRRGLLSFEASPGFGNVKVVSSCGYSQIPKDLELAVHQACAFVRASRRSGMPKQSEGYEGYSYSLASMAEAALQVGSTPSILARYKRLLVA